MKYTIVVLLAFASICCKQKMLAGKELEDKLKETMTEYLHQTLQPGVEVTVKDVSYYPDKKNRQFICRFHVEMRSNNKDTTGVVGAFISDDFKTVDRSQ